MVIINYCVFSQSSEHNRPRNNPSEARQGAADAEGKAVLSPPGSEGILYGSSSAPGAEPGPSPPLRAESSSPAGEPAVPPALCGLGSGAARSRRRAPQRPAGLGGAAGTDCGGAATAPAGSRPGRSNFQNRHGGAEGNLCGAVPAALRPRPPLSPARSPGPAPPARPARSPAAPRPLLT